MRRQTGPATDEIGMRRKLSFYFSRQPLVVSEQLMTDN